MLDYKIYIFLIVILILLLWFFWPEKGIYSKIKLSRKNKERILIEDALKFIFDCEYKQVECLMRNIAENLSISEDKTEELVRKLKEKDLIKINDLKSIVLTTAGKEYAIRIIRIHRVWERYLSEETGLNEHEWHKEADKKEHFLTIEKADEIASKIGNPVFDPHGDPIPNIRGEIPLMKGKPLDEWKENDHLIITHLEDEPSVIYSQLVVMGLYPGVEIMILEKDDDRVKFFGGGKEHILSLEMANSITAVATNKDFDTKKYLYLNDIPIGETVLVKQISPESRGLERRRFMDLGIIPGVKITPVLKSPGGDPIAYDVLNTEIALRKKQSKKIIVDRLIPNKF